MSIVKCYFNGEQGYLYGETVTAGTMDYRTLSHVVGSMVLCNGIMEKTGFDNWELWNGCDYWEDQEGDVEYKDIYQYYIITEEGAKRLQDLTDTEIVYYNEDLNLYLWGITHYGTPWNGVETDIIIEKR